MKHSLNIEDQHAFCHCRRKKKEEKITQTTLIFEQPDNNTRTTRTKRTKWSTQRHDNQTFSTTDRHRTNRLKDAYASKHIARVEDAPVVNSRKNIK